MGSIQPDPVQLEAGSLYSNICKPSLQHTTNVKTNWRALICCADGDSKVLVDGYNLTIADIIKTAQYGVVPAMTLDPIIQNAVQQSVELIERSLQAGQTVYGVTTGFGGSADTRTTQLQDLQTSLQQHLSVGILLPADKGLPCSPKVGNSLESLRSHAMPVAMVKAMMLLRCNSLMRGHSGVRLTVINAILTLIAKNLIPVVPLRGSISASGDLSPLAYISGVLEGNPNIYVRTGRCSHVQYLTAPQALAVAGLEPIRFRPKEVLGLVNGTAASCAAAAIAIHQANQIGFLTQILTAMATEALLGTIHNYHPFIASTRPHPGQIEAAINIYAFLSSSKLVSDHNEPKKPGLAQDRYALRTATQWIGPQLEDLILATNQIEIEINSTTDNPLLDVPYNTIHHGGNFQAASLTSAMEKTMTAVQMLGKLIFAQCSELLNPMLNKGLPPNLCADDPSISFTFKGFDVNMAAYMAELAYLAHPVSSHIQTAEMHNQAVNSMALVAARYTSEAIEVVWLMIATYVYALCQALDLRCLHLEFVKVAEPKVREVLYDEFGENIEVVKLDLIHERMWEVIQDRWASHSTLDINYKGLATANDILGSLIELISLHRSPEASKTLDIIAVTQRYRARIADTLSGAYDSTRKAYFEHPTALKYLCSVSKIVYTYVRRDLNIPFHRGLVDHPTTAAARDGSCCETPKNKTIGSLASDIYIALRNGDMFAKIMKEIEQVTDKA